MVDTYRFLAENKEASTQILAKTSEKGKWVNLEFLCQEKRGNFSTYDRRRRIFLLSHSLQRKKDWLQKAGVFSSLRPPQYIGCNVDTCSKFNRKRFISFFCVVLQPSAANLTSQLYYRDCQDSQRTQTLTINIKMDQNSWSGFLLNQLNQPVWSDPNLNYIPRAQ